MFILGLNGSSNREGNTAFMLQTGLEAIREAGVETKLIHVADALKGVKNPFCTSCSNPCKGICSKGNSLGKAFELMVKADGIIIGSPVYFGTVSGQLKAFWDKTRFMRKDKTLLNVIGGVMTVGGSPFGGQEATIKAIHDMMFVQGMTVVGDGFVADDAGHSGACARRPSIEDQTAMKRAVILAKRVAEVAQATEKLRNR